MALTRDDIAHRLQRSASAVASLAEHLATIERLCGAVRNCLRSGGRVYTCGNGGSAAQALHLSEELIGRYRSNRAPLPAVCLCADPTALTCIANDFGYEQVFARQLEALARPGDVLVALTTSGNSPNIVHALRAARTRGATTVGLLGKGGGECLALCDIPLVAPAPSTEHIQEAHLVLIHLILEAVESP